MPATLNHIVLLLSISPPVQVFMQIYNKYWVTRDAISNPEF